MNMTRARKRSWEHRRFQSIKRIGQEEAAGVRSRKRRKKTRSAKRISRLLITYVSAIERPARSHTARSRRTTSARMAVVRKRSVTTCLSDTPASAGGSQKDRRTDIITTNWSDRRAIWFDSGLSDNSNSNSKAARKSRFFLCLVAKNFTATKPSP